MQVTSKCAEGNHVFLLVGVRAPQTACSATGCLFYFGKTPGKLKHCSMPLVITFLYVFWRVCVRAHTRMCVCALFLCCL